jgi:hypothetical protein
MAQTQFPEIVVRDYGSLVDALRAAKEYREISHETLEQIAGLCGGFVDKLLGVNQDKKIGPLTLGLLLAALGVRLRLEPDPEQAQRMAHRWDKRNSKQVRVCRTVSQYALDRCRPVILSEMARKGWATRRARNGNGHAER